MNKQLNHHRRPACVGLAIVSLLLVLIALSTRLRADSGSCGGATISLPFTDVPAANPFFCVIAAAYFSGLTSGTSATTYGPGQNVTREQMAAFTTRTLDQSLRRGSRRAALNQFSTPAGPNDLRLTTVGNTPVPVVSDGADLWVGNRTSGSVSRVRASDGKLLGTWTTAADALAGGIIVAAGQVFITDEHIPTGKLYRIDPTGSPGPAALVTSNLGPNPTDIAFDGSYLWIVNQGTGAGTSSVSKVDINTGSVSTFLIGFVQLFGILYDGANIWVTDAGDNTLKKLNSNGNVIQTINVGSLPTDPLFDGINIWVCNANSNSVTIVRAATGMVISTLTGNGLLSPFAAAFDGERVMIVNFTGDSVTLWKGTDFTPLGSVSTGGNTGPSGVCSDGLNFWITLKVPGKLARF